MAAKQADIAHTMVERHGRTYAEQAGIKLKDTPAPLYQLLVLSVLLSARISSDVAVAAAAELFKAGYRTPKAMLDASWQQRVDALGRGHYRRYDERTATMLGNGAELVTDRWRGDLRQLHAEGGDAKGISKLLQEIPGIGPAGAAIFCREVPAVWPDLVPYVDNRTTAGARRVGLPTSATGLAGCVSEQDLPRLVAACVRASLNRKVVEDVRAG